MKKLPSDCPGCSEMLAVKSLWCASCGTEVVGDYPLPPLARLSGEDALFVLQFVDASGSLKQMAKHLGISYPTVRNRLDDIIAKLRQHVIETGGDNNGQQ